MWGCGGGSGSCLCCWAGYIGGCVYVPFVMEVGWGDLCCLPQWCGSVVGYWCCRVMWVGAGGGVIVYWGRCGLGADVREGVVGL